MPEEARQNVQAAVNGLTLHYDQTTYGQDTTALLWTAQQHGLLTVLGRQDGHLLVLQNGRRHVLTVEEVSGYVLGLFHAANQPTDSIRYRQGLL